MSLHLQQIGLQSMGYPLILPKQTTCYLVILPVTFQVKSRLMIPLLNKLIVVNFWDYLLIAGKHGKVISIIFVKL